MRIKLLSLIIFILSLSACSNESYLREYEPLIFDGNNYIRNETLMNEKHFNNVEKVLSFYKVSYQCKTKLLIKFDKPLLSEAIFNYGKKAENIEWLKSRGFNKT